MSLGDRLGIVGLIVALIGIASFYLWPDKKWIGYLSVVLAGGLLIGWTVLEVKGRFGATRTAFLACLAIGALIGSGAAALIWRSASFKPVKSETTERKESAGPPPAPAVVSAPAPPAPALPPVSDKPRVQAAAALVIKFTHDEPYRVERKPSRVFRIGIYNAGTVVADNVSVKLVSIKPRPSHPMYGADFPYPLFTLTGNEFVRINPKEEELFALLRTWLSSEGQVMVAGLNKKVPQNTVNDPVPIEKDEVWRLFLRAAAANASASEIELVVRPGSEAVDVERIAERPNAHKSPPSPLPVEVVRRNIQDNLAAFVKRGTDLRSSWVARLGKEEDAQLESAQAIQKWHLDIERYIKTIPRGTVYLAKFESGRRSSGSYPIGISIRLAGWWDTLVSDMETLNALLGDADLGKP